LTASADLSPCIGCCRLDDDKICKGCFRSIDEIRDWRFRSEDEQQKILQNVADRRTQNLQTLFPE